MVLDSGEQPVEDGCQGEGDGGGQDGGEDGPEDEGVTLPEPELADEDEWGFAGVVE